MPEGSQSSSGTPKVLQFFGHLQNATIDDTVILQFYHDLKDPWLYTWDHVRRVIETYRPDVYAWIMAETAVFS